MSLIDQHEAWKLFRIHCPELAQQGLVINKPYTIKNVFPPEFTQGQISLLSRPEKHFQLGILVSELEDGGGLSGASEVLIGIMESRLTELSSNVKIPRTIFDITISGEKMLFFYLWGYCRDSDTEKLVKKYKNVTHSPLLFAYLLTPENMRLRVAFKEDEQKRNIEGGGSQRS